MKIEIDTCNEVVTVDGVTMPLCLLRCLADPNTNSFYRFTKAAGIIQVETFKLDAETLGAVN